MATSFNITKLHHTNQLNYTAKFWRFLQLNITDWEELQHAYFAGTLYFASQQIYRAIQIHNRCKESLRIIYTLLQRVVEK